MNENKKKTLSILQEFFFIIKQSKFLMEFHN